MAALAKLPVFPVNESATHLQPAQIQPAQEQIRLDRRAFTTLASREEAEYLLLLDHSRGTNDSEWTAFFVESFVEFLVWKSQPWGAVGESDVDWLVGIVADAPSPSAPALLFALVRELNEAPERLISLALKHSKGRVTA